MSFSWRQLLGLVGVAHSLSPQTVDDFIAVGGKGIAPVLLNDSNAAQNQIEITRLRKLVNGRANIGGWFNGTLSMEADALAGEVARLTRSLALAFIVLDLEFPYKEPHADRMPELLVALRKQFPLGSKAIAVSSFGFADRAMIWGGQARFPSFRRLNVHYLPQAYFNDPAKYPDHDARYAPDWSTKDLSDNGATNGNLQDLSYADHRGLPLNLMHHTLEPTGVQEASLADGLARMKTAQSYGLGPGMSLYLLERTPSSDWPLLAAVRGVLYK